MNLSKKEKMSLVILVSVFIIYLCYRQMEHFELQTCTLDKSMLNTNKELDTEMIASDEKHMYRLDRNDNIYYCEKPCDGKWIQIQGALSQITTDGKNLYGVNSNDYIFTCPAPCKNGNWRNIPGFLRSIDANHDTLLYGVNKEGNRYLCEKPCAGNWRQL